MSTPPSQHLIVAHLGVELGPDVGDDPEFAIPHRGAVGVVQQDEAPGGELLAVVVGIITGGGSGGGRAGQRHGRRPVDRWTVPVAASPAAGNDDLGAEGHSEWRQPGGRRDLVEAQFAAAACFAERSQRIQEIRGNLGKCVHNRRVRNGNRQFRQARRLLRNPAHVTALPPARTRAGRVRP